MKRRKVEFPYIFIDVVESRYKKHLQNILVYSIPEQKFYNKSVVFYDWIYCTDDTPFYANPQQGNPPQGNPKELHPGVIKVEEVERMVLWGSTEPQIMYRVFFNDDFDPYSQKLKQMFADGELTIYEVLTKKERFITHHNLHFLDSVQITPEMRLERAPPTSTPVFVVLNFDESRFLYTVNSEYILKEVSICEDSRHEFQINDLPHLTITAKGSRKDYFRTVLEKFESSLTVWNLFKNFVCAKKRGNRKNMPIPLDDLFDVYVKKNTEQIKKYFEEYFQVALLTMKIVPVSITTLFTNPSKKYIMDNIFFSKSGNIVAPVPKEMESFTANQLISMFDGGKGDSVFVSGQVVSFDFDSMYPSILLDIYKNNVHMEVFCEILETFLKRKRKLGTSPMELLEKKFVKLFLNSFYGWIGISAAHLQHNIQSNPDIAAKVCKVARRKLKHAIKFLSTALNGEPVYCHTDSVAMRTDVPIQQIVKFVEEWNAESISNGSFHRIKIENVGNRLLIINKLCRVWYNTLNDDLVCKGSYLNSAIAPVEVVDMVKEMIKESLRTTITITDFVNKMESAYNEQYEKAQTKKVESMKKLLTLENKGKFSLCVGTSLGKFVWQDIKKAMMLYGDTVTTHNFHLHVILKHYYETFMALIKQ